MAIKKSIKLVLPFLFISSILSGCFFNKTDLPEAKGDDLTYSEYFNSYDNLDVRENVTYYKPVSINDLESSLPEQVKMSLNTIDTDRLPFKVDDEKAYLITSKGKNGKVMSQVQASYLSKSEYNDVDEFLIISKTEVDENPLQGYDITDKYDSVGNKLKKEVLTEDLPIYQQVMTTDSALLYSYYDYDKAENSIFTVGTSANEIYAFYNGYIYHIGYVLDEEKYNEKVHQEMLSIAREYILGDSL